MGALDRLRVVWRNRFNPIVALRESHITCSQYGEDMVFERLLRPGTTGTFVDVGANHPYKGSNTFRLYAHGWRGLTIEPNPKFSLMFSRIRPGDKHLCEGVSPDRGSLIYYEFDSDVMNTFDGPRARSLMSDGHRLVSERLIACRPLAEIVDEHLSGRQIDLLTIDCEGFDLPALKSLDLSQRRPTVLMVEDYAFFKRFQGKRPAGELEEYLTSQRYEPIAQTAWSTILVAEDWSDLFKRSAAYSADRVQNGYLPGQ